MHPRDPATPRTIGRLGHLGSITPLMYIEPNADIPIIVVLNLLELSLSYLSNTLFLRTKSNTLYRRILLRTMLVSHLLSLALLYPRELTLCTRDTSDSTKSSIEGFNTTLSELLKRYLYKTPLL